MSSLPTYLEEDEDALTQECKDLLPFLPREKGWVALYLYKYQGFWNTLRLLEAVLACQKHFHAQDSDIFLVTTPKSGTTWLKAIIFALVNRFQFPPAARNHPLLATNPHALVPFLEFDLYVDKHVPDLSSVPSPRLFSTHLPVVSHPESLRRSSCKIVYLCRNPRDVFVSLWHFTHKLRPNTAENIPLEEAFDMFCRGQSLSGPFWDHALGYWNESLKNPDKVFFLKYEEMKLEPHFYLKKLAEFLGCPISTEEEKNGVLDEILKICSFDSLRNLEVNKNGKLPSGVENKSFFRRGEIGDWKNHLTPAMAERLNQITQEAFSGTGLKL